MPCRHLIGAYRKAKTKKRSECMRYWIWMSHEMLFSPLLPWFAVIWQSVPANFPLFPPLMLLVWHAGRQHHGLLPYRASQSETLHPDFPSGTWLDCNFVSRMESPVGFVLVATVGKTANTWNTSRDDKMQLKPTSVIYFNSVFFCWKTDDSSLQSNGGLATCCIYRKFSF